MTSTTAGERRPPGGTPAWQLTDLDLYLFNEGTHRQLADKLGAHPRDRNDRRAAGGAPPSPCGRRAPGPCRSSVTSTPGTPLRHPMTPRASSGSGQALVTGADQGDVYKYALTTASGERLGEGRPVRLLLRGASAHGLGGVGPGLRMGRRRLDAAAKGPDQSSTRRCRSTRSTSARGGVRPGDPDRLLGYAELAPRLVDHVTTLGFTHVEFLPVMEHPFYGSWGYQTTGYFAPTARYGTPQEFMYLIDQLHQAGIGVILDWVPSHFPTDAFALGDFDGTHLYEHADPRQGFHPGLEQLHLQLRSQRGAELPRLVGRALAVRLPRRRAAGRRGGLDALPRLLPAARGVDPQPLRRAGEPRGHRLPAPAQHRGLRRPPRRADRRRGVDGLARRVAPADAGGLGFGYKWDMGWMHDTLVYLHRDPVHRRYHHDEITFRGALRLHRELRAPPLPRRGGARQGARCSPRCPATTGRSSPTCGCSSATSTPSPGKKLLFMGAEIGQWREWDHDGSLDWHLLEIRPPCRHCAAGWPTSTASTGPSRRSHELDCEPAGFEWVLSDDDGQLDAQLPAPRQGRGDGARGLQLHPGAALPPAPGRPDGGSLARAAQQRRRLLRRERHRQPREPCSRARPTAMAGRRPRRGRRRRRSASWCSSTGRREHAGLAGIPLPLGATWDGEGVNFALFSEHATAVELCFFDHPDDAAAVARRDHARGHRPGLALLPARRPPRALLRLPGRRPLRPARRAPLQPGQAAHRSLRQGGERDHPLERRALRLHARRTRTTTWSATRGTRPAPCPSAW